MMWLSLLLACLVASWSQEASVGTSTDSSTTEASDLHVHVEVDPSQVRKITDFVAHPIVQGALKNLTLPKSEQIISKEKVGDETVYNYSHKVDIETPQETKKTEKPKTTTESGIAVRSMKRRRRKQNNNSAVQRQDISVDKPPQGKNLTITITIPGCNEFCPKIAESLGMRAKL